MHGDPASVSPALHVTVHMQKVCFEELTVFTVKRASRLCYAQQPLRRRNQQSYSCFLTLLLVLTTRYHLAPFLEYTLKVFVYSKSNSLTGGDTHDARCNTLVETPYAFLLPHIPVSFVSRVLYISFCTQLTKQ